MMNQHELIDKAYDTLKQTQEHVILLHPNSRYRSLLLAKLLNDPSVNSYYYALDPDDINVHALVESMTRALSSQYPLFGRFLNLQPEEIFRKFTSNEELVMTTFARELASLTDQPFYLLMDEYDRSDYSDDIHRFVELLAEYLPPNCTLILNGRTLPRLPWIALIAKRKAAMLMDEARIESDFYGLSQRHSPAHLEARTLGPGLVYVDGDLIDAWEGHLPRLLLFFSLDRPVVTRSEICQAFWPGLEIDQAVNVFHVTKRRLHKALGEDVLIHTQTHYRVNPEIPVYYDAVEFVEALAEGRNPNGANRVESWKKAASLYGGPFLQGHEEKWVQERRSAYRFGYMEALMNVADHWIGRERYEMAIRQYEQAITEEYSSELAHRQLLKLYTTLGRRSEAVAHYQTMSQRFQDEKRVISPETEQVYADIVS